MEVCVLFLKEKLGQARGTRSVAAVAGRARRRDAHESRFPGRVPRLSHMGFERKQFSLSLSLRGGSRSRVVLRF